MTYWDNTGKYQAEHDRLYEQLVPASGNCETVEGENLRAISRIYYDYFNNGFMNNWTGALKWLIRRGFIRRDEQMLLEPWSNSQIPHNPDFDDNAPIPLALEAICDRVLEDIIAKETNPLMGFQPNTADMFDLQDRDDSRNYDEDEDYYR